MSWDEPPPRSVVIVRALQLGDLVCAVPTLRALRQRWPRSRFALVGLPWARAFVTRYSRYLDALHEFPGWPGLPERTPDIARIPAFLQEIQAQRYDLAVQLHGSGSIVNELTALLGARRCAGFYLDGDCRPDAELFVPYPDEGLEVHRLLKIAESLGGDGSDDRLEFPLFDGDRSALARLQTGLRRNEYVCVHPGASVAARRWPEEHFRCIAGALAAQGFTVVFTGTAAEAEITARLTTAVPHAIDLAGKTDLGALGVLLAEARLLVCNDTGVAHVAAAVQTPSVVISTGNNPERWAPTDRKRHRVLCDDRGVPVHAVLAAVADLLQAKSRAPVLS